MPISIREVVDEIIAATDVSLEEKYSLLALAGTRPSLWETLYKEEVVGVLRSALRLSTPGMLFLGMRGLGSSDLLSFRAVLGSFRGQHWGGRAKVCGLGFSQGFKVRVYVVLGY